tara:strand:+ start:5660 stop:6133 length:474 start_codon:yes stop_codon:yes gene_type:complete
MSLLNLKTKTEPLYKPENIINNEKNLKGSIKEQINNIKENSSLIIGEGASIKGEIKEENEINVQGIIEGDVSCQNLIIGKTGSIKGKINAKTLYVEGNIEGEINVKERLKLMSSSYVSGKITYGSLEINEGGKLISEGIVFKDKEIIQDKFKDWKAL